MQPKMPGSFVLLTMESLASLSTGSSISLHVSSVKRTISRHKFRTRSSIMLDGSRTRKSDPQLALLIERSLTNCSSGTA